MDEPGPPIVLCAFGSTVASTRTTYANIETAVRTRFPSHEVHWAYTSSIVRRALTREGVNVAGPLDVFAHLKSDGHHVAVVQPLHISPGQEFEQLASMQFPELRLQFGRPLLDSAEDRERVMQALDAEVRKDVPNVFVAHGNNHKFEYNLAHLEFAKLVRREYSNAILASLEGDPGVKPLDSIRLQVARARAVHFIPLLLVSGDHVLNDVLGEGSTSWKNRLGVAEPTCSPSLGENPKIVEIFLDHLDAAISCAMATA